MKVKFCGISSRAEAETAVLLGADYVGFLVGITHLAEDKLTNRAAREIIEQVDFGRSIPIAVTHLTDASSVIAMMRELGVRAVQLHDNIGFDEIRKIRDTLAGLYIIKAVHVEGEMSIDSALAAEEHADALVLDSRTADRIGGTGLTHDWSVSRRIVEAVRKPVFLAGGLNPDNLRAAIDAVHPFGVDVNSGVEFPSGEKDPEKMKRFIQIARTERSPA